MQEKTISRGPRHVENTLEVKAFAEELFDRISREVVASKENYSIYYRNLMESTDGQGVGVTADVMWHAYLRYFQSLFDTVKN